MTTRINLRNYIAQRIGDYYHGTAEVPTTSCVSYTTIYDSNLVQLDSDYWQKRDLVNNIVVDHGSTQDIRRVSGYVPSVAGLPGGFLAVSGTLSSAVSTITEYYLYRRYSVNEYNDAINSALREASDMVEVVSTYATIVATSGIREYAIATTSDFKRVIDVFYLDDNSDNQSIKIDARNWDVDRIGGVLTLILRRDTTVPQGKTIRIDGAANPTEMSLDTQALDPEVPVEYVINKAAAILKTSSWRSQDTDDSARYGMFLHQQADNLLKRARPFVRKGHFRTTAR